MFKKEKPMFWGSDENFNEMMEDHVDNIEENYFLVVECKNNIIDELNNDEIDFQNINTQIGLAGLHGSDYIITIEQILSLTQRYKNKLSNWEKLEKLMESKRYGKRI